MNATKGRLQKCLYKNEYETDLPIRAFLPQRIFLNLPNKLAFKKYCTAYIKKLHEPLRENPHKEGKW